MVGSSFNSPAESNYAPIEGECLGVASALHKTRYYTQGCDKLLIGTDHKSLLGVLNDRSMESIDNPGLIRLKEKTLGWRFKIIHIPGKKLCGPDALSQAVAPVQGEVQMMAWGQGDINPGQHWSGERYPSCQGVRGISTSDYLSEERYPSCQGESFYNLQSGPIDNSSIWGTGESVEMLDHELTTKDAREGILGAIRATMSGEFTLPDPSMDVSECLLASMELGVKSVSWAMVKNELSGDGEFKDLADWISGGCIGPP